MTYREARRLVNGDEVRDLKTRQTLGVEGVRIDVKAKAVTLSCVNPVTFERGYWGHKEVEFDWEVSLRAKLADGWVPGD